MTRELDFYEKIIEKFDTNQISLIVNDIKTNEIERKNNTLSIIEKFMRKKGLLPIFRSLQNLKFNVIISTGLSCPKKLHFIQSSNFLCSKFWFFFKLIKTE